MTKKKGFFSKIKTKLSKNQDDLDDSELVEHEAELDEEYELEEEDEDEDEEYEVDEVEIEDEDHQLELPPPAPPVEDPTLEVYIDDLEEEDTEDKGFLNKLKKKLIKNDNSEDTQDFDDDEEEYDEDEQEEDSSEEDANKYNVMQRMLLRIKSKASELDTSRLNSKKSKGQLSGPQHFLPNLLSSESRPKIHHLFIITLTCVLLYQVGKTAALFLNTKSSKSNIQTNFSRPKTYDHSSAVSNIRNYNPFNIQEDETSKDDKKVVKPKDTVKVCKVADNESKLGLKLENTIVLQNSLKSVASVKNRGKLLSVRIGSRINNIAEIGNISRQKLIFKNLNTGECEYITNVDEKAKRFSRKANTKILPPSRAKDVMPEFNKDIIVEGNNFKIKKELRNQLLSNIGDVLTQAKAITIKNPDGSLCFKMTDVKAGSIYSYLNVQNDDIICEINGAKINNMNQIMGMFGKIKSTDYYELGIKRNGVQQSYNYNFVD